MTEQEAMAMLDAAAAGSNEYTRISGVGSVFDGIKMNEDGIFDERGRQYNFEFEGLNYSLWIRHSDGQRFYSPIRRVGHDE